MQVLTRRVARFTLVICCALVLVSLTDVLNAQPLPAKEISLDFHVIGFHIDRDGKHAIAWGKKIEKNAGGRRNFGQASLSDEVAVIDLEAQKVMTQQSLAAGIQSAMIQKPYAFLTPKSGNVLYRFDAMTLGKSKRMFLKNKGLGLTPFTKQQIGVVSGDHNHTYQVIDPDTMKPTQTFQIGYTGRNGNKGPVEVEPGILNFNSMYLNVDDGSVAMLQQANGFQPLVAAKFPRNGLPHQISEHTKTFGRFITNNSILSQNGTRIAQLNHDRRLFFSPHHQVAFGIRVEPGPSRRSEDAKHYFETYSLVDGEVLDSKLLEVTDNVNAKVFHGRSPAGKLYVLKDKAILVSGKVLAVLPINQAKLAAAAKPLHFPVPQVPFLDIDKPQTLRFKAEGGKGKLNYQLLVEYEGIEIDSATGTVTVDTPKLWESYLKTMAAGGSFERFGHLNSRNGKTPLDKVYKDKFGKPLPAGKTPFTLPIFLAVTDEESQEDRLALFTVVHGDKAVIEKTKAQREAQRQAARQEQIAKQKEMREQFTKRKEMQEQQRNKSASSKGTSARIDVLEKRMRRMEATLDLILEKVQK